jgi:hypothetical protein
MITQINTFEEWITTEFGQLVMRRVQKGFFIRHWTCYAAAYEDLADVIQKVHIWLWINWSADDPDYTRITSQARADKAAFLAMHAATYSKGPGAYKRPEEVQKTDPVDDHVYTNRSTSIKRPTEDSALLLCTHNHEDYSLEDIIEQAILEVQDELIRRAQSRNKPLIASHMFWVVRALQHESLDTIGNGTGIKELIQQSGMSRNKFWHWKSIIKEGLRQRIEPHLKSRGESAAD